jgi:two-component sensor histidine kinase
VIHALPAWLNSLRARVVVLLLLASMPAVIFAAVYALQARERAQDEALMALNRLALAATAHQGEALFGTETLLVGLSVTPMIREIAQRAADESAIPVCDEPVPDIWSAFPQFLDLRIIDRAGRTICASRPADVSVTEAGRAWFERVLEGRSFVIGDFEISAVTGLPAVVAAAPLTGDDGEIAGVLAAEIGLDWIDRVAPKVELPQGGYVFLLDMSGEVITRYPKGVETSGLALPPQEPLLTALLSHEAAKPFLATGRDGVPRAYGIANLSDIDVSVLVSFPQSIAFASADKEFWSVVARIAVVWVLTLAAAWFVTDKMITRPVRSVIRSASAIRRGDLATRPAIPKADSELKQLAVMFTEMADRVEEREVSLRQAVKEREALLREVHHRVKNNLQIITSLLNMQMSDKRSAAVAGQLLDAKTRIRALGIVHDQLYRKTDLTSVDLKRMCEDLCKQFWQIYGVDSGRVRCAVNVPSVAVDMDRAIPLSLLIAEALTNALKHAFPNGRRGTVTIAAEPVGDRSCVSIRDDGVGLREADRQTGRHLASLGMRLMQGLAEQLDAELELRGEDGTELRLSLPAAALPLQAERA